MPKDGSTEYWKQQLDRELETRRRRKEEHFYDYESDDSEYAEPAGWTACQLLFVLLTCVLALFLLVQTGCNLVRTVSAVRDVQTAEELPETEESSVGLGEMLTGTKGASDLTDEEKLEVINANPAEYPAELRALVQKNPETLDYVYQYPMLKDVEQEIDLTEEAEALKVPLLMQWDTRWGYASYGSGMIGYTGCGPTCLSMVAIYLTGNAKYTPALIASYAEEKGYYTIGSGTAWSLMSDGCTAFGVRAHDLGVNETDMITRLREGSPIICSVGPGDFTDNGHYLVITGYNENGFTVNDPNSRVRSSMTWSYARLSAQINTLWYYTAD